ncbi:ester cyclase [Rhodobacter sphaeroides]|uniref:ester cyclase n=1 Tax=Cereibacter sphaeroides TaxID=1063 RepID=UPI0013209418|nr:ester cyclase [Cereibacter sphaeroides]MWP36010.1 ester cyclase [Cereibacter sphaeroides]
MTKTEITEAYRAYIACLNRQDWERIHEHVADRVTYNGAVIGVHGYREMLVEDFRAIPDLAFNIALLVCDPPVIASRLIFDCTPKDVLFGLPVNGKRVRFEENVFYQYQQGKIAAVWSIIDKAAVAAQL